MGLDTRLPRITITIVLAAALAACKFEPSIITIAWPMVPPQPFGQFATNAVPGPSPVPLAPTPPPPPPVFEGMDSLDCTEPMEGDDHYGYCRIPETQQFYVWGECIDTCPDGPYPGIQIMTVEGSNTTLQIFREVVDKRGQKLVDRTKGIARGGVLGGLGVAVGIPGIPTACIVSGSWNGGTGCLLLLLGLGADGFLAWLETSDGIKANTSLNKPLGLNDSAQDLFQMLHESGSSNNP